MLIIYEKKCHFKKKVLDIISDFLYHMIVMVDSIDNK